MNIGVDIRPLMSKRRTGVGEYTLELLNAVFKIDKENQYFLFYNSYEDVSANIPWANTPSPRHPTGQAPPSKMGEQPTPPSPPCEGGFSPTPPWILPENVRLVATRYPNKLFNAGIKLFGWPRLDRMLLRVRPTPPCHPLPVRQAGPARGDFGDDNIQYPISNNIDVFFSPNLNFISVGLNTKFVLTIHDLSFEFFPEFYSLKQRLWHKAVNPRKQCRRADLILTPSENTKRDIVDYYGINPDKIRVIYPGLSPVFQEKILNIVRKKYALPENYILFLGTAENRKNIIGLIKAFEMFNIQYSIFNISLVIAGPQGCGYEEILQYAQKSPCKDKIKFIGYIDAADKPALYAGATLFVYPSFYEGFGFPVLEAMAAGAPVITSNRSSLPEITGPAAYLIDPNNPNQIARAMAELLTNHNLRNLQIKNGLARAAHFSWQKTAEHFLSLFPTLYP